MNLRINGNKGIQLYVCNKRWWVLIDWIILYCKVFASLKVERNEASVWSGTNRAEAIPGIILLLDLK